MRPGKPPLAPKIAPPNKKKPNFFRESDKPVSKGKSPMAPLSGKKLSK